MIVGYKNELKQTEWFFENKKEINKYLLNYHGELNKHAFNSLNKYLKN
jgi:hypothetical protein